MTSFATGGSSDAQALAELDREVARSLEVIRIDDALIASAIRLTRTRRLRAADAIQLASALAAREGRLVQGFIFVASDVVLNSAALAEGLQVENPEPRP